MWEMPPCCSWKIKPNALSQELKQQEQKKGERTRAGQWGRWSWIEYGCSYLQQFSFGWSHFSNVCKLPFQHNGLHLQGDHSNDGFLRCWPLWLDRRRQRQPCMAKPCVQGRHEQPRPEDSQLQQGASTHATSCSSGLRPHIPLGNASSPCGGLQPSAKLVGVPSVCPSDRGAGGRGKRGSVTASAAHQVTAPGLTITASLPWCHVLKGRWELKGIF